MIRKELDEDRVRQTLTVLRITPALLVPGLQDLVEAWRRRLVVNALNVGFADLKGLRNQVWHVLADKHVGIDELDINLLEQV